MTGYRPQCVMVCHWMSDEGTKPVVKLCWWSSWPEDFIVCYNLFLRMSDQKIFYRRESTPSIYHRRWRVNPGREGGGWSRVWLITLLIPNQLLFGTGTHPRWKRGSIINVNCRTPDVGAGGDDLPNIERSGRWEKRFLSSLPNCLFPGRQFSGFSCFALHRRCCCCWFACFKSAAPVGRPQPNWFVFPFCFCGSLKGFNICTVEGGVGWGP